MQRWRGVLLQLTQAQMQHVLLLNSHSNGQLCLHQKAVGHQANAQLIHEFQVPVFDCVQ
jgi:hypothetical protein